MSVSHQYSFLSVVSSDNILFESTLRPFFFSVEVIISELNCLLVSISYNYHKIFLWLQRVIKLLHPRIVVDVVFVTQTPSCLV